MKVEDLFAELGVKVDKASFAEANLALVNIKRRLEVDRLNTRKATDLIGLPSVPEVKKEGGIMARALGSGFASKATLALGAGFIAKSVIGSAGELGAELTDLSQKLGVTTDDLQKLGAVASANGSGFGDIEQGLKSLANTIDNAKGGNEQAITSLKALGVSLDDPAVKAGDLNAVFLKLADGVAAIDNPQRRLALSQDVLGKSGSNLIRTLAKGGAGIRQLGEDAAASGKIIKAESIAALDAMDEKTNQLGKSLKNTSAQAVALVAPQLTAALGGVSSLLQTLTTNSAAFGIALGAAAYAALGPLGLVAASASKVYELLNLISEHSENQITVNRMAERSAIQDKVITAREQFGRGEISKEQLDKVRADAAAQNRAISAETPAQLKERMAANAASVLTQGMRAEIKQAPAVTETVANAGAPSSTVVQTTINVTGVTDPWAIANKKAESTARNVKATLGGV